MPRVFAVLIAVVVCSLGSVAYEARAQVVPFTLEASGVLANVDPSAYPRDDLETEFGFWNAQ